MRVKTDFWVKGYIRRCAVAGVVATVVRHGDDDAGAIFIRINRLNGQSCVYGPAPAGLEGTESDRRWVSCFKTGAVVDAEADAYLRREAEFDSDLWIVELESRDGAHWLDGWLAD
jgi:hypothetical protein